ncbi:clustered mitochondria protein homolog [Sardina pilchardus]|uniref:clustered mitochondria protein homolog n=1 Tax=Sardina pilchardus TaxID=27697 RepID=UPI002E0DE043
MKDNGKKGGKGQGVPEAATNGKNAAEVKQEDDGSFSVKIQGPGVEPFELQVHGFWLVQDVVLAALGRDEVAPRTSLSLALSGVTLDPLVPLQQVKGLKPGAILRLVEEPYSPRSARAHLARVQDLLRAAGPHDSLKDGRSPSILSTLTHTHTTDAPPAGHSSKGQKRPANNTKTDQPGQETAPPEYILPGATERPPLATLLPADPHSEVPSCLLDLSLSCWNPPPGPRKLQGDFLYITVHTREGRHCDITSCPRGFFLNRSTAEVFDPRPSTSTSVCHCLSDLLSQISPEFKQNLTALRNRNQRPSEEALASPYRVLSWLGPASATRSHRHTYSSPLAIQEHIIPETPDWNEELQAARDLPQRSLEERLQRDRAIQQVNSAFVWAATQGAETVIDGCVDPVNGAMDEAAFLWSGVFLSQGGAAAAHLGGERGKRTAQRLELRAVQAYSQLDGDLHSLHTLPTAVVDYRGVRLSAQGLAPGSQGSEAGAPRGLLYGFAAGPLENPLRRKLLELLAQSAKGLSLQRHAVMGPARHQVPLFTSVDAQGLLGADGRYYVLDVFRTMPADANYQAAEEGEEAQNGEGDGKAEDVQAAATSDLKEPCRFPHALCRLRPELVKAFIQHKNIQFTQRVRERMEENGGVEECVKPGDPRGAEAVRGACKDVGSISDIIFEMRFNPNVFTPGVEFARSETEAIELQKRLLKEAGSFILTHQIPALLEDCLHCHEMPIDGAALCRVLHERGINLRYLGQLTTAINKSEDKDRLRHIRRLAYTEIVLRSAKRIFNNFLQSVEVSSLSAAVSHFLCCLLLPHHGSASAGEEPKKRSRRRGRGGGGASDSTAWSSLSGNELWSMIGQDAKATYGLTDGLGTNADHLVEHYGLQKMSLLREFCLKTGVQLRLRDYALDNRTKAPIGPDDVYNILPVVKHLTMTTQDASRLFRAAQGYLQKGQLDRGYEQLKEAAYLFGRVCDDLHPEACSCLSLLAKAAYLQGRPVEARSVQLRVVVISERVLGFDHPNTIKQYALLAVYVYAGGEVALAQRCLYRARLLMLLVHGEDHPYIATLDSSLGLVLQGPQSIQYLQNALKINSSFRGDMDVKTALNHHLLAQKMCVAGDYRAAMNHEREAQTVFKNKCGEDHPQTKCSAEFLTAITQQAVRVERSLRQAAPELPDFTTPETLAPSTDTILEQLALVNGILKTSYSEKLLQMKEKLREKKALEEATETKSETPEAANGRSEEQSANEGEVAEGETTPSLEERANGHLSDTANAESKSETPEAAKGRSEEQSANEGEVAEGETTPSLEERANGHLSDTANAESPIQNGNCSASDTDEEGGATRNEDQSRLTNGEAHSTAASNQSDEAEPKTNGVSGCHDEEDNTKDGALIAVSKSASKVAVSVVTDAQSEATVINGGDSVMTNGEVTPALQDSE